MNDWEIKGHKFEIFLHKKKHRHTEQSGELRGQRGGGGGDHRRGGLGRGRGGEGGARGDFRRGNNNYYRYDNHKYKGRGDYNRNQ